MTKFDCQYQWKDYEFKIAEATLHYIGNVNPKIEWEARGLSGYEKEKLPKDLLQEEYKKAQEFLKSQPGLKRLQAYLDRCSRILDELLEDPRATIERLFPGKKFIFIIGALRTGGTYLYTELCKIYKIDHTSLNQHMSHDGIPHQYWLQNFNKDQFHKTSTLFEIAQFLLWAEIEFKNSNSIIQKNVSYAHGLKLLNQIFGNKASYIISIRHPLTVAESIDKYLIAPYVKDNKEKALPFWQSLLLAHENISENIWSHLSYYEKACYYWKAHYQLIGESLPLEGQFTPLCFGEEYEQYLFKLAYKKGMKNTSLSKLYFQEKAYKKEWPDPEWVEKIIFDVHTSWIKNGLEFPNVKIL